MAQHYKKHAESLVEDFKEMLDEGAVESIGEENFNALSMLIESAITTTTVEAAERIADKVSAVVTAIRKGAENYDDE